MTPPITPARGSRAPGRRSAAQVPPGRSRTRRAEDLRHLRRRWWWAVLAALACGVVGWALTQALPRVYEGEAVARVTGAASRSAAHSLVPGLVVGATSDAVLDSAASRDEAADGAAALRDAVTGVAGPGPAQVRIRARAGSPERAAAEANGVLAALARNVVARGRRARLAEIRRLQRAAAAAGRDGATAAVLSATAGGLEAVRDLRLDTIRPARDARRVSVSEWLVAVLAAVAAAAVVLPAAVRGERLLGRFRSAREAGEDLGLPAVEGPADVDAALAGAARPARPGAEADVPPGHVLLIAGVDREPDTAKVTAALADAYVAGGRAVAALDGDLRRARLHTHLGTPGRPGVAELVTGRAPAGAGVDALLQPVRSGEPLDVLPAGRPSRHAVEALASERGRAILDELAPVYDAVLVALAPVGLADVLALGPAADGVVLVLAKRTSRRVARVALEHCRALGTRPVGVAWTGS